MAKSKAVWGIDIGQSAIKALRGVPNEDESRITAEAFDYIEYPKILSQPEADPVELVREALRTFLSRNVVRGDRVAISVSGQSGLARFIKLPPVESKKIPDIVKYEARQQIPFALEDVVWDYQQMAGGSEEDGFALETEVGLFAMKRDQVYRALKPFQEAGIEVDIVQLTLLVIYNYTVFDQMHDLPPADQYDPENPPESVVVLSLGTDSTDLVITNGYRVWQRSIPLGGSHFTKALTKDLRLTFAKAEHLKRNATQAEDPKAIFQAMRPVFSDLLTQIQHSINFFSSIDRGSKIGRLVVLGNAIKLPGLQKYLAQNLGYPVTEVEGYRGLSGPAVTGAPAFKENMLSFAVCYGLVLQGLGKAKLATNLLPREILSDRMIRAKKPWVVGVAAAVVLGCSVSFVGYQRAWESARTNKYESAFGEVDRVRQMKTDWETKFSEAETQLQKVIASGETIAGVNDRKIQWVELMEVIKKALPHDDPLKRPARITNRKGVHVAEMEMEYWTDLNLWYQKFKPKFDALKPPGAKPATPAVAQPEIGGDAPTVVEGPTGAGWVIQITGFHYYLAQGEPYARNTIVSFLDKGTINLPLGAGRPAQDFTMRQLGIQYPLRIDRFVAREVDIDIPKQGDDNDADPKEGPQGPKTDKVRLRQFNFVIQFCWQPTTVAQRLEKPKPPAPTTPPDTETAANQPPAGLTGG